MKKKNVLQLHVDGASERAVGPKKGRSTGPKEAVYLGGVPGECTAFTDHLSDADWPL